MAPETFESIVLIGNLEFLEKTKEAILILKNYDPISYRRVKMWIRKIYFQPEKENASMCSDTMTCYVGKKKIENDPSLYAMALTHEAGHSILHNRFKIKKMWSREREEKICVKIQLRFDQRLGNDFDFNQTLKEIMDTKWYTLRGRLKRAKREFKNFLEYYE